MPSSNKRFNILKQICSFLHLRKLNFRTHHDLQASHNISIFAVFKKLSQKGSHKMMHFVFKTLKLLTLEFQFWKTLMGARGCKCPPRSPPAQVWHCYYRLQCQLCSASFLCLIFYLLTCFFIFFLFQSSNLKIQTFE